MQSLVVILESHAYDMYMCVIAILSNVTFRLLCLHASRHRRSHTLLQNRALCFKVVLLRAAFSIFCFEILLSGGGSSRSALRSFSHAERLHTLLQYHILTWSVLRFCFKIVLLRGASSDLEQPPPAQQKKSHTHRRLRFRLSRLRRKWLRSFGYSD